MFEKWKNRLFGDAPPEQRPLMVLAVTASQPDRDLLRQIFEKAGWKALLAAGFDEAVRIADAQPVPIVLWDRDLPGSDWRQAIERLSNRPSHSCVILASSVADDYLWEEVIHCGGYDILPKPFREDEVIHTVRFAWAAINKTPS
jgi:DNA-binding response OmpR family regulator